MIHDEIHMLIVCDVIWFQSDPWSKEAPVWRLIMKFFLFNVGHFSSFLRNVPYVNKYKHLYLKIVFYDVFYVIQYKHLDLKILFYDVFIGA